MPKQTEDFAQLFEAAPSEQDDNASFQQAVKGIKPLKQDKIHFANQGFKQNRVIASNKAVLDRELISDERDLTRFHFSDEYEPHIPTQGALSFVREGHPGYLSKLLRRGDLPPEMILDLHGYSKDAVKRDLADLIESCKTNQIPCACVIHGVSGGVLKRKVPHYLMQHPDVIAIHQAPLEWGGQGALVFIINIGEELEFLIKQ